MSESQRHILRNLALFGALSDETLDFLLQQSVRLQRAPGDFFFHEEDQAQSVYVLESGRVAVIKHWRGQDYLLKHLDAGECFGEMALIDMHTRSASVVAVEDCEAFSISAAALMGLYEHNLEQFTLLQMNMGREVSRRLREATERIFHLQVRAGLEKPPMPRRFVLAKRGERRWPG